MPTTYQGFDVLEIDPGPDRDGNNTRSLARLDYRTGKVRAVDRTGVPVLMPKGFRWVMDGRSAIQEFYDFRAARKGALVPFWVPTWRHDLELVADILNTGSTMTISNVRYTTFMFPQVARRYLAIFLPDGTWYYRKVTGASEATSTETLTLDSNIPVTVPKEGSMVSFLTLVRLAVDDPELTWHNRDLAEALLDFVELPREVPA